MNELIKRVATQIDQALGIEFNVPNDTGHIDLDADIASRIDALVEEAASTLEMIEERFAEEGEGEDDSGSDSGEVSVLRAIGAEISSALAQQELADLAFVGRHQLIDIRKRIAAARESKATWKILAHCETALRRVLKALVATESTLREYAGLPPIPRDWESLDDALEIRQLYGQFRRAVTRRGEPKPEKLTEELARITRRIAILRDLTIYPYLRIGDRREIRRCQKRIEAWLREDDGSDEHRERGHRLWQDVVAFAKLLAQVSNREALAEHDRNVIANAIRVVSRRGADDEPLPEDVFEDLQTVIGRDDELDALLLNPHAAPSAADWRPALTRLLGELEQPYRLT